MKRTLFARTLLFSMLTSALLSFTACKTDEDKADEDKCKEGDLVACVKAAVKDVDKRAANATNGINESKDVGNENSSAGSLVDQRDGKKYKIVKIGNQTWMAENLNYKMPDSYCYEEYESNCSKYGRLYEWKVAKKACPNGWHLPSKEEFETLFESVGGKSTVGSKLKFKTGWVDNGNGSDDFGFSALPAGTWDGDGSCNSEGDIAYFWSSTEYNSYGAYIMYLYSAGDEANLDYGSWGSGFSVRCIKD